MGNKVFESQDARDSITDFFHGCHLVDTTTNEPMDPAK